jgi:lipopolysaccharide transport protein LptA
MFVKYFSFAAVLIAAIHGFSQGIDVFKLFGGSSPARKTAAPSQRVSILEKEYRPEAAPKAVVTNTVERVVEKPVEVPVVRTVTNTVERVVEKPVEVTVVRTVTNTVERVVEKPVEVEKVVYDRSTEKRLQDELDRQTKRGAALEAKSADLAAQNNRLQADLAAERAQRSRLERLAPKPARKLTGRPAHITSATTYYDRKQGVAFFDGNVHVDDEQYQLHARRAYVFMDGSNDVRRIVAIGNVAMTNEARRAYGAKVSYYKEGGMVVLYSGDGITAEVRDESKEQDQTVRGKKIKFWIDTEQVEVIDADISAPTGGMGKEGLKGGFNKIIGK